MRRLLVLLVAMGLLAGFSQPAEAACPAGERAPSAVHLVGVPDVERTLRLGALTPGEIARDQSSRELGSRDQSSPAAVALSELRTQLSAGGVDVALRQGLPAPCADAITLLLRSGEGDTAQSYSLSASDGNLVIEAASEIGLLYGAYEAMHAMGYRWYAENDLWRVIPAKPVLQLPSGPRYHRPRFALRGAHTFDAAVSDAHLLWMARNRQNLIGHSGVDPDLARVLGIRLEGGGHNLVSTILHSERKLQDGRTLLQAHPEWYGLTPGFPASANPIPYNAEEYANPCYADQAMARFFVEELTGRLLHGDLQHVAVLNLWPSDRPQLNLPAGCLALLPGQPPVAHLLAFYGRVMGLLQAALEQRAPQRRIVLAGIAYYDTWEVPEASLLGDLRARANVSFTQVLYVNERSYASSLNPDGHGTNRRIAEGIRRWSAAFASHGLALGICEYYNYSIYYSLPASFSAVIPDDYTFYERQAVGLVIYMHPVKPSSGPHRLMEAIRSRLAWTPAETVERIEAEYFRTMYGTPLAHPVFGKLDRALGNMAEMFGNHSSLLTLLSQHRLWSSPPLAVAAVPPAIEGFLAGGTLRLPLVRQLHFSPFETRFAGLRESVALLTEAESEAAALFARASAADAVRLEIDLRWFGYAKSLYTALLAVADGRLLQGSAREDARAQFHGALTRALAFEPLGSTLSAIDQRATLRRLMEYAGSSLDTPQ